MATCCPSPCPRIDLGAPNRVDQRVRHRLARDPVLGDRAETRGPREVLEHVRRRLDEVRTPRAAEVLVPRSTARCAWRARARGKTSPPPRDNGASDGPRASAPRRRTNTPGPPRGLPRCCFSLNVRVPVRTERRSARAGTCVRAREVQTPSRASRRRRVHRLELTRVRAPRLPLRNGASRSVTPNVRSTIRDAPRRTPQREMSANRRRLRRRPTKTPRREGRSAFSEPSGTVGRRTGGAGRPARRGDGAVLLAPRRPRRSAPRPRPCAARFALRTLGAARVFARSGAVAKCAWDSNPSSLAARWRSISSAMIAPLDAGVRDAAACRLARARVLASATPTPACAGPAVRTPSPNRSDARSNPNPRGENTATACPRALGGGLRRARARPGRRGWTGTASPNGRSRRRGV